MKSILFALILTALFSCKKESAQSCERWNVQEQYVDQSTGRVLNSNFVTISVCGDDLTAAHSGKQTKRQAGAGTLEIVTYLSKVN